MRRWLWAAAVSLVVVGCSDTTGVPDDEFRITMSDAGLEVTNDSDVDLFYQAIDSEALALWAGPTAVTLCVEPDCPHVAPGETVVIAFNEILGHGTTTTRVTVYWWRATPDGQGGWRVRGDDLRSREILLS